MGDIHNTTEYFHHYCDLFEDRGVDRSLIFDLLDLLLEELDFRSLPVEEGELNYLVTRMNMQVMEKSTIERADALHKKGGEAYNLTLKVLEFYRDLTFFQLQQNADYTAADYGEKMQKRLISYTPDGEWVYEFSSLCQILEMSLNEPWRKTPLLDYLGSNLRNYSSMLEYMVAAALECLGRSSRAGKKRRTIIEYLYTDPLGDYGEDDSPWLNLGMKRSAFYYNHQKAVEFISVKLFGPYGERLRGK